MTDHTPSGPQAAERDTLIAWLERRIADDPGGVLCMTSKHAQRYVDALRTAAPTAPSTAEGERERLEEERNRLSNHFGYGARLDGSTRERIAAIDARLAALATPPAQMKYGEKTYGEGRDEAANFIFTGLSEALGLDGFTIQDGSETWDGDVRATLMGILRDANVIDEETNERITPPAPSVPQPGPELDRAMHAALLRSAKIIDVPWQEQAAQIRRDALEEAARICRDEAMLCRRDMRLAPALSAETCAYLIRALLSKPAKGEGR